MVSVNVLPVKRKLLNWDEISNSTKQRYTKRSAEIVAAVLQTLSPDSAGPIWQTLIISSMISKLLGTDELTNADHRYLKALSEAYNNASSWATRRQVLSIMTEIASFNMIATFIPGLTKYRYTSAHLHQLQYGRGVQVQEQSIHRIKVDLKQLAHFLSFITSPHLVQDIPYGQKHLTLSSGQVLEVPNVIRTMIPSRIVKQYVCYCKETNFHPFSESTMHRILSECSATVRKSLQGLDYFSADGTTAFDSLLTLIPKLIDYGVERDWAEKTVESLKAAKLYLKGDYKVVYSCAHLKYFNNSLYLIISHVNLTTYERKMSNLTSHISKNL